MIKAVAVAGVIDDINKPVIRRLAGLLSSIKNSGSELEIQSVVLIAKYESPSFLIYGQHVEVLVEKPREHLERREEHLSNSRNMYLRYLRDSGRKIDFLVVADLDQGNFAQTDFSSAIQALRHKVAVFGMPSAGHYDLLAFRKAQILDSDYRETVSHDTKSLRRLIRIGESAERIRQLFRSSGSSQVEVSSAFNGLGIYRFDSLGGAIYSSSDSGVFSECEHVGLHSYLTRKGFELAILPGMRYRCVNKHHLFLFTARALFKIRYPFGKTQ